VDEALDQIGLGELLGQKFFDNGQLGQLVFFQLGAELLLVDGGGVAALLGGFVEELELGPSGVRAAPWAPSAVSASIICDLMLRRVVSRTLSLANMACLMAASMVSFSIRW
jgi:hypothetical protein